MGDSERIASPQGDRDGRLAFTGHERIAIHPNFFQRLDAKVDAERGGHFERARFIVGSAVDVQAIGNAINPGWSLPESEAILLARYMVARWGGHHVAWILNGDGHYHETAERWHTIGRGCLATRNTRP